MARRGEITEACTTGGKLVRGFCVTGSKQGSPVEGCTCAGYPAAVCDRTSPAARMTGRGDGESDCIRFELLMSSLELRNDGP